MSSLKNKIVSLFRSRKANVFILFLVLALLFSVLTKLSSDYTKTVPFKVENQNVPEDVVIISDSLHTLDITLTTYGFKFLRYYLDRPSVMLNFDKLSKTESAYYWTKNNGLADLVAQFEANVKIESVNPDSLVFRYDKNATKLIPVVANTKLSFAPGFDIVETLELSPDSVKAVGPQSILDSIYSVSTDTLKLGNVNKDISTSVAIDLLHVSDQVKFSHEDINVNAKVEKFTEGSVDVPISIRNLPEDFRIKYYPKTIKVFYYTSLGNFKNVTAEGFTVVCDFENISDDTTFLIPELTNSPKGVKNVRLDTKRVEFITIR